MGILVQQVCVESDTGQPACQIRCRKVEDFTTAGTYNYRVAPFAFQDAADGPAPKHDTDREIHFFPQALQPETMTPSELKMGRQMIVLAWKTSAVVWTVIVCVISRREQAVRVRIEISQ